MQTELLTSLSSDLFASMATSGGGTANTDIVPQGIDFSALLFSMLSMKSMPANSEVPTGDISALLAAGTSDDPDALPGQLMLKATALPEMGRLLQAMTLQNSGKQTVDFSAVDALSECTGISREDLLRLFAGDGSGQIPGEDSPRIPAWMQLPDPVDENPVEQVKPVDLQPAAEIVSAAAAIAAPQSGVIPVETLEAQQSRPKTIDSGWKPQPAEFVQSGFSDRTSEPQVLGNPETEAETEEAAGRPGKAPAAVTGKTSPSALTQSKEQPPARVLHQSSAMQQANAQADPAGAAAKDIESLFPEVKVESLRVTVQPKAPLSGLPVDKPEISAAKAPAQHEGASGREINTPRGGNTPSYSEVANTKSEGPLKAGAQPLPAERTVKLTDTPAGKIPGSSSPTEVDGKMTAATTAQESSPVVKGGDSPATTDGASRVRYTIDPESLRPPIKMPVEIRLRIHPEKLGVVKLQLRMIDNHLSARVIVQSSTARMAVEGSLADLQRNLADAGVVVDRFEVSFGHTSAASATDPDANPRRRRYAFKPKTNRRYQEIAGLRKTELSSPTQVDGATAVGNHGRLNMVA